MHIEMVNYMYQLAATMLCPDSWSDITLGVPGRVVLHDINIKSADFE